MLLDLSGMTREKRVEEQASINVIQQPRVHLQESRMRPKEKGKDTHRLEVKHRTMERVLASQILTSSRTTIKATTRLNERIFIEHTAACLTLEATAEKKFQIALSTTKIDMFSTCVVPAMSLLSRQPGLAQLLSFPTGRITILTQEFAHSWGKPKNELIFPSEMKKLRAKAKSSFLCPSCLSLENRRQRMKELRRKPNAMFTVEKYTGHAIATCNVSIQFVSETPGASSSNDDTTAPLQPTGEGHNVFRSQRLQ